MCVFVVVPPSDTEQSPGRPTASERCRAPAAETQRLWERFNEEV